MTAYHRPSPLGLILASLILLSACSSGPRMASTMPVAPASASEIDAIVALLDRGESRAAKRRIEQALESDPLNATLMMLLHDIDNDAKEALGDASFPYTVQSGDTMAGLAERFLGNRLKSYQLARYNDIAIPARLSAGAELRIPGQAARSSPEQRPAPARGAPSAATAPERPARPASTQAARPARTPADAAAAQRARSAGLTALNQGRVSQSVTLLRRAASLDPGNPTIAADLARAERIARTVRSRN